MVRFLFLLSMLSCSHIYGQFQCGTTIPRNHILNPPVLPVEGKSLIEYDLNKTLTVNIYIVASGFETYDFGTADYTESWELLNEIFAPINMRFEICSETLIPNYNYNDLSNVPENGSDNDEEDEMLAQFYVQNTINVYYVASIENIPPAVGYAYFPGGPDVIVLEKSSEFPTLIHEMGHFFGLYHTFDEDLGIEFVNGENCETTGDLVCDTPADNQGPVNDCQYTGYIEDVNGDPYIPLINNYMSYYPSELHMRIYSWSVQSDGLAILDCSKLPLVSHSSDFFFFQSQLYCEI